MERASSRGLAWRVVVHEGWRSEEPSCVRFLILQIVIALRCERQALPSCVMWPTATPILHITRGFAIVRYMLAAHTTHKNFFADVVGTASAVNSTSYLCSLSKTKLI